MVKAALSKVSPLSKGDEDKLRDKLIAEIEQVDKKALSEKGNADFVMRNLALACWVLQRRSLSVRRILLRGLIGPSQLDRANQLLKSAEFNEYILKENDHAILFSGEFMDAVEKAYNIKEYHFGLSRPIPYFDRRSIGINRRDVPGYKFIEYINLLLEGDVDDDEKQPTQVELLTLMITAFSNAVAGVDGEIHPDFPVARIYREDESWNFLLMAYPSRTMLSEKDIYTAIAHIHAAKDDLELSGKHHNLKTLFISPAIDRQADAEFVRKLPNVYHCWSVSVLRFFNMLKDLNTTQDEAGKKRISDNFTSIFPPEPTAKFSSREAIERLKKNAS